MTSKDYRKMSEDSLIDGDFTSAKLNILYSIDDRLKAMSPKIEIMNISNDMVASEITTPLPADITEEPPCGSQVTDCDGEVWGRLKEGWQVWDARGDMEWSGDSDTWAIVRSYAPLRPTTDADRERVGLPVKDCGCPPRVHVNPERTDWLDEPIAVPRPEPVDITEEPPVGSQLTDIDGDVWERFDEGWLSTEIRCGSHVIDGPPCSWNTARLFAPLRPTTDVDRVRVGLKVEPAPADVDPDEALAKAMYDADPDDAGMTWEENIGSHDAFRTLARAAREHIEDSLKVYYSDRATKAEADLAKLNTLVKKLQNARRDVDGRDAQGWKDLYDMAISSLKKTEDNLRRLSDDEHITVRRDALAETEAKADLYDAMRKEWVNIHEV